jgi:hypothetical protein
MEITESIAHEFTFTGDRGSRKLPEAKTTRDGRDSHLPDVMK